MSEPAPRTLSLFDAVENLPPAPRERALEFSVYGEPVPQGSGKAIISASTRRAVYIPDHKATLRNWRQSIGEQALARRAARGLGGVLLGGPVRLVVRFTMPRRKSWRNLSELSLVAVRPDIDKLARAIADALTNVAFEDDGQLTTVLLMKRPAAPGEPSGVDVAVGPDVLEPVRLEVVRT